MRSSWWFLKFSNASSNFKKFNRNVALQRKGMKIAKF
jgi:hypothetical protein